MGLKRWLVNYVLLKIETVRTWKHRLNNLLLSFQYPLLIACCNPSKSRGLPGIGAIVEISMACYHQLKSYSRIIV